MTRFLFRFFITVTFRLTQATAVTMLTGMIIVAFTDFNVWWLRFVAILALIGAVWTAVEAGRCEVESPWRPYP